MSSVATWDRRAVVCAAALLAGLQVGAASGAAATGAATGLERAAAPVPAAAWGWPLHPPPPVVSPFEAPPWPYAAGHRGVDLAGLAGSSVRSAGDGVVAFAGMVAGRGVISIDHAGGLRTTYEPVTPVVRDGEPVARGQVVGVLAAIASHCLPQACLHWGLRRGETYLDPLSLVGARPVRLLPVWSAGQPDRGPLMAGSWGG